MMFRPERFVLSEKMACELSEQCLHVASIEVSADGTAALVIEPDEVDFWGCSAVGVGGHHSESFADENGRCEWCGLDGPWQTRKDSP